MSRLSLLAQSLAALALTAPPVATWADPGGSTQSYCGSRTKGSYGFQCQGSAAVSAAGLEPVTLLGSVTGNSSGRFAGTGTFSSSLGSARQRVVGEAVFADRSCAGRISYAVFLVGPNGEDLFPLPDRLDINFVTVNDFKEILGTPYSPTGTGAAVPRLSCRLVKVSGDRD